MGAKSKKKTPENKAKIPSPNTLSRQVTTKLLRRIIDGAYRTGTRLPTERDLAEEFDVARPVVREALKRIEALGLITIRQGSGARVEDFQTTGGVELADLLMARGDGSIDKEFLGEVLQLHENMHIWLAKTAAQRITLDEIKELRTLVEVRSAMAKADERLPDITMEISRRLVQASHNRYMYLLFNTLARTTKASRTIFELPTHFEPGIQTFFERLLEAFENRDHEMAALLTARVFEINRENYLMAVSNSSE